MKQRFTPVLLVLALSICKPNSTIAQVDINDSLALVALYNSTDGPNWIRHDNWLTSMPVNEWYGIILFPQKKRIVLINLSNNNLNGSIPAELGNFANLKYLILPIE